MKLSLIAFLIACVFFGCESAIKNKNAKVVVEEGTQINEEKKDSISKSASLVPKKLSNETGHLLGFWVGDFKQDVEKNGKNESVSFNEYVWNKDNKINISIDRIQDTLVYGHSVVAGNDRPFEGSMQKIFSNEGNFIVYQFSVKEPGNDQYDGQFTFEIKKNRLVGTWSAYKDINIKHRKYSLSKKEFKYDPDIELGNSARYIDWQKQAREQEVTFEDGDIVETWIEKEFASATHIIYQLNASNTKLEREDVANLSRGDLTIIRNTIYARHGYSFKNQPLRVFFDAQDWYIPVHADIRSDFTELEKENIKLLLSFEKNAAEYYDRFGRG